MNHFDIHLKLTQYCKSTILQYKIKNFKDAQIINKHIKRYLSVIIKENFLAVQWLGLCAFTSKGPGSISGRGAKIQQGQKKVIKDV